MDDLVSIIMPSYNTDRFIQETIECVLSQTYSNWELIIVDDCSSDKTKELLSKIIDSRIKVIYNEKNSGAAVSRNKALAVAKGRYIAFLDSDDLWHSDKLQKQVEFMRDNGYHFSYTKYEEISEAGEPLNIFISGPKCITRHKMLNYCWMGCLTVMYDADYVGTIQIKDVKKNNDYAMWLKVSEKTNCYLLDENLAKYRIRQGSISRQSKLKLIKHHYLLFRVAEERSVVSSVFLTMRNIVWGIWKKIKYIKYED